MIAAISALCMSCTSSKEDRLVQTRLEQRRVLDRLYATYGGGQLAGELQKETARGVAEVDVQAARDGNQNGAAAAKELLKVMGNAVGEFDLAAFEAQCETLGGGQRT